MPSKARYLIFIDNILGKLILVINVTNYYFTGIYTGFSSDIISTRFSVVVTIQSIKI